MINSGDNMWRNLSALLVGFLLASNANAYSSNQQAKNSRRTFLATSAATVGAALLPNENDVAWASGGATAGKYTYVCNLYISMDSTMTNVIILIFFEKLIILCSF